VRRRGEGIRDHVGHVPRVEIARPGAHRGEREGVRVRDEVLTPEGARVKVGADTVYLAVVGDSVVTIERQEGGQQGSFVVRRLARRIRKAF